MRRQLKKFHSSICDSYQGENLKKWSGIRPPHLLWRTSLLLPQNFKMLKIKVKAGSITNLTDARYFAAREVEWLGFRIGRGPGMIGPVETKAIAGWVDGVRIVGEFGLAAADEIWSVHEGIGFDAVQVGMFMQAEEVSRLKDLPVIKEVIVDENLPQSDLLDHLNTFAPLCDSFLLDFSAGPYTWDDLQQGRPWSVEALKEVLNIHPVILHLDCRAPQIEEMLGQLSPYALSLKGGEEEKTGIRSFDDLDEILDVLEIDQP